MKRFLNWTAAILIIIVLPVSCRAAEALVPVGRIIGLQLRSEAVTVAAFDDVLGREARDAGLRIGDQILAVNNCPIREAEDVAGALEGRTSAAVTVRRGGKQTTLKIPLQTTADGQRLGVYLRQGIGGIGTVTWYDPETGYFGALGHGVNDSSGTLLRMTGGSAYDAFVESVKKGKAGAPGQLRGCAESPQACGDLIKNTPQGVFGKTEEIWEGDAVPVAEFDEVTVGPATIRATVQMGEPQDYSVEILKIYPRDRSDGRNFLLKVSDPRLLEATGGIVQGMSGSPIIQDGRIVGAVTHVLVNDPTTGYGIFIENMLDAAG
ncbi:MAG: SpoIVB peptidase S55 domain-containing protein [Faecousia sp.]